MKYYLESFIDMDFVVKYGKCYNPIYQTEDNAQKLDKQFQDLQLYNVDSTRVMSWSIVIFNLY